MRSKDTSREALEQDGKFEWQSGDGAVLQLGKLQDEVVGVVC